jgi:hypothetical protein
MLDSAPVHCVRIDGYISESSTSHENQSRTARIHEKSMLSLTASQTCGSSW